ncbi:hypothetical protein OF83DRAFT_1128909 [Amylostereum chailletii]|nr:hypothetical protein OF83DRAFT_1128909 [Amylostereum chailletii]
MSYSPTIRRLSNGSSSSKREEDLINAYEAEEERIINVLSRKLEKLQEEKIDLENVLEAESESHVNRLSRELSVLRLAQQQAQLPNGVNGPPANGDGPIREYGRSIHDPPTPSSDLLLESMRRDNEQLRARLVDTEREYIRISRLNEIYREELIEHRRRLGLPMDNLIGLSSAQDPYSQPTHRRSSSNTSSNPQFHHNLVSTHAVPIPRPPSQIHRPVHTSETTSSSLESPSLSPTTSTNPTSSLGATTHVTTPPSSGSLPPPMPAPAPRLPLSYPSVPPPSLSSSFGSPVTYTMQHPSHSPVNGTGTSSPVEHTSRWRRGSNEPTRSISRPGRESIERGARIAETGAVRDTGEQEPPAA